MKQQQANAMELFQIQQFLIVHLPLEPIQVQNVAVLLGLEIDDSAVAVGFFAGHVTLQESTIHRIILVAVVDYLASRIHHR